jgi:hypothetical protein
VRPVAKGRQASLELKVPRVKSDRRAQLAPRDLVVVPAASPGRRRPSTMRSRSGLVSAERRSRTQVSSLPPTARSSMLDAFSMLAKSTSRPGKRRSSTGRAAPIRSRSSARSHQSCSRVHRRDLRSASFAYATSSPTPSLAIGRRGSNGQTASFPRSADRAVPMIWFSSRADSATTTHLRD